jgi:rhodanese-related sulfurtransferase
MARSVDAVTVKSWLSDGGEIAFLDVREHGQYGEGHPFLATSVAYSRFETGVVGLVPNIHARMVLIDAGDGVAEKAARRAEGLGYRNVSILVGGVDAWQRAGYVLFAGVNVPSKTFGEMVELKRHTPRITAAELQAMIDRGERHIIVDGRPYAEFMRMSIPGAICCPNGELALRIGDIVRDPETTIVVNCAGRTRSIIGAQTLIDCGVPNRVLALENGTQGWFLAGLELERGARRKHGAGLPPPEQRRALWERARKLAEARGVAFVSQHDVEAWLGSTERTTYLLDVRSPDEFAGGHAPAAVNAPGGQLIQATDQWVGVKGARVVLLDNDGVRAPVVAQWLRQLGHEACVLDGSAPDGGLAAAAGLARAPSAPRFAAPDFATITAAALAARTQAALILDVRSSTAYRAGHIEGATWACRPRLADALPIDRTRPIVVAGEGEVAALAADEASEHGLADVKLLVDGPTEWAAAGLTVVATPLDPPDAACIDYLFFVHDRHDGNRDAARRYLEWEMGLLAQLDENEKRLFRVADPAS